MSKKPETIRMHFEVHADFHIESLESEFGIKWQDVKHVWMKWGRLNIDMTNGDRHIVVSDISAAARPRVGDWPIDPWKWPSSEELLDEDFEPVDDQSKLEPEEG